MFYANNKNQIHWVIFLSCILAYWVSNTSNPVHISEAKSNTTAQIVQTWVTIHKDLPPTNVDKEVNKKITTTIWNVKKSSVVNVTSVADLQKKNIQSLSTQNKIENYSLSGSKKIYRDWWNDDAKLILIDAWISKSLAHEIVNICSNIAKDRIHCIKYASSISAAESWWWKKCYNNNCFWIKAWSIGFKTLSDWVTDWVTRYNKYWHKATSMTQFYAPRWKLPYFRYCTSENSSDSSIGCPNWLKHSQNVFNKLDKLY